MDNNMLPSQSVVGLPPRLGTPVPGTVGGLPAQGGLSVLQNPMAKQLQSMGRGQDTMLVHMTPQEVGGLQQLAMAAGGSLTINPHTGLPEAGWLGKLLPTILGAALSFVPGVGPLMAAGLVGAGTGIAKGDLGAGLMAGLQAFGGASLARGLGSSSLFSKTLPVVPSAAPAAAPAAVAPAAAATTPAAVAPAAAATTPVVGANALLPMTAKEAWAAAIPQAITPLTNVELISTPASLAEAAKGIPTNFLGKFAQASRAGLPAGTPGIVSKYAPQLAGLGLLSGVSGAMQPKDSGPPKQENKYPYMGPYAMKRELRMPTEEERQRLGTGEFQYFTPSNPMPVPISSLSDEEKRQYGITGYAEGGEATADDSGVYGLPAISPYAAAEQAPTYSVYGGAAPETGAPMTAAGLDALANYYRTSPQGVVRALEPQNIGRSLYNVPGANERNYGIAGLGALGNTPVFIPQTGQTVPASNFSQFAKGYWGVQNVPYGQLPDGRYFFGNDIISESDYLGMIGGGATHTTPTTRVIPTEEPTSDPVWASYLARYPDVAAEAKNHPDMTPEQFAAFHYATYGPSEPSRTLTGTPATTYTPPATTTAPPTTTTVAPPAVTAPPQTAPVTPINPYGIDLSGLDLSNLNIAFAQGGTVNMRDGSFVLDARTVSELGNGSSNAGKEILARMGGRPLDGPGDGVSDSIPARIGDRQRAKVARDEVIMPPEVVNRIGRGNPKRGADKLYALMDRAHKARRKADRGQDTNLRRGLV